MFSSNEAASFLNCKIGTFPFVYLGLPIGADGRRMTTWKPVLEKIKSRLASWDSKHLSLGGKVVLLKSVLTALPIYFFSFFKAPEGVIGSIEKMFRRFLWGGSEEKRSIHWVAWAKICRDKAEGGLGLKNLKALNFALLGKWRWRLKTEEQRLWVRVLHEKYGAYGGVEKTTERMYSGWWKSLLSLEKENSGFRREWFSAAIKRVVGNGTKTQFWTDNWMDDGDCLRVRFSRLFSLSLDKAGNVADIVGWRDGEIEWNWKWRRGMFQWKADQLNDLQVLVEHAGLKGEGTDRWVWKKDPSEQYTVSSAYKWLRLTDISGSEDFYDELWGGKAPLKVKDFVWKLAQDRIPSLQNLVKRKVTLQSIMCRGCEKEVESSVSFFPCYGGNV